MSKLRIICWMPVVIVLMPVIACLFPIGALLYGFYEITRINLEDFDSWRESRKANP
jgi:hypothetical protein